MARLLETIHDPRSLIVHELPVRRAVLVLAPDGSKGGVRVVPADAAAVRRGLDEAALALVVPDARRATTRHVHLRLVEQAYRNAEATPMSAVVILRNHDLLAYGTVHGPCRLFFDDVRRSTRPSRHRGAATTCPFCRQSIEPGDSAIRCPDCGLAYHEELTGDVGCWSASRACCGCGRRTAEEELSWVPAGWPRHEEGAEVSRG